ncbi:stage IV sporulation protein B [Clostridium acetobutylicum]|uniref:Stage IV sporulation protein B, SpoIVB n=1 Tax=Clostridium acetobutylicum (strain ATCC 824 / DSM 792 / JCM 1419 / IAM 19013 / LMG 5710 / NBRC 13948 / NRRL B-527 / VKM B-1787 / 2291 / W) TaxID=272562 RepID=Q97HE0_CLOAB|nr:MULTISPECIES: SpoIVB peptidase [Clostridium]AAK80031.1 Stage IV sporulation protein B, SpoIVB [Clostridium acetobutylicum ATCC 824]ADZ21123.1 Stage IV sporulation protein B, SpoIVB [Clostridium acetobutylicum EA 2018]AEI33094.1 stage IV sporulation protein B, SpoIVB [Clostridium acetobutylicum DSM 1731]AWV79541.1 SpoIVB peptidase [Clostridium acetobutylicum]MBC2394485.1 SpoIVB peptidase [Clostridium acetobutylicum]
MKNKKINIVYYILTPVILVVFLAYNKVISTPQSVFIKRSQNRLVTSKFDLKNTTSKKKSKANEGMFGISSVKSASIKPQAKIEVYPGGQPIGIKLHTKGVLIVGFSDIDASRGRVQSPAANSGIQIGDSIVKVNEEAINTADELGEKVNKDSTEKVKLTVERKGKIIEKVISKVKCKSDENYKIGLWVRDSTAGIGTLTFYSDKTKVFGALGHPITDVDTGDIINISRGSLIDSSIVSVNKGIRGNPGELRGIFINENKPIGIVKNNTICGLFGKGYEKFEGLQYNKPMEVAMRNEVKLGPAKILTTIDGSQPKMYAINIEKLFDQSSPNPKSMMIKVTDAELLDKTGGIVQGMSGSPIIQNNKVVGAVTHVLINKPDTGYGVYIEWMLKSAGIL